jgi:hypothetical protein
VRSIIGDLERLCPAPPPPYSPALASQNDLIQATCFASLEEIQQTVRLLNRVLAARHKSKSTETSASASRRHHSASKKRRNCGHVTRDQIIDTVGGVVEQATKEDPWKVKPTVRTTLYGLKSAKRFTGVSILEFSAEHVTEL